VGDEGTGSNRDCLSQSKIQNPKSKIQNSQPLTTNLQK
jgi:hypothetical protein